MTTFELQVRSSQVLCNDPQIGFETQEGGEFWRVQQGVVQECVLDDQCRKGRRDVQRRRTKEDTVTRKRGLHEGVGFLKKEVFSMQTTLKEGGFWSFWSQHRRSLNHKRRYFHDADVTELQLAVLSRVDLEKELGRRYAKRTKEKVWTKPEMFWDWIRPIESMLTKNVPKLLMQ